MERILAVEQIKEFEKHLHKEEKSLITIEKYIRDVQKFIEYTSEKAIDKEWVISYKKMLIDRKYAVASINSMLASVNSFLKYLGWQECCVKGIRMQKKIYCAEEKELSKEEYGRLLLFLILLFLPHLV